MKKIRFITLLIVVIGCLVVGSCSTETISTKDLDKLLSKAVNKTK